MDEQVYKNLCNIKQNVDDHVEEYYEQILTLVKFSNIKSMTIY